MFVWVFFRRGWLSSKEVVGILGNIVGSKWGWWIGWCGLLVRGWVLMVGNGVWLVDLVSKWGFGVKVGWWVFGFK